MLHLERDEGTYDFIVFNGDMGVATAYYVEEENHAWELVLNDDNSTLLGTYTDLAYMLNYLESHLESQRTTRYYHPSPGAMTQTATVFDNSLWIIFAFLVVFLLCIILGSLGLL